MKEKQSLPSAPILIESIRSIGYSFQAAIADLIDNAISAKAKRIDVITYPNEKPFIIIFDNGKGMSAEELEEAMRLGSKNPNDYRDEDDLGRFGLGLKSASLSQCKNFIIVSKKDNTFSAFSWDLDYVIKKDSWSILELDDNEIFDLPNINLFDNVENGTYVILRKFDKIEAATSDLNKTLTEKINLTIDHLSLVFHRYISDGLEIYVNNTRVEAFDPFLSKNKATIIKRTQKIKIGDSTITVKPYILPHFNKLTEEDLKKVGGKEELKKNQGFYVYRNKRLIIWGTWFRLSRQEELGKLARVMVDIPNSLDEVWEIDVKKSTANIPDIIKKRLYSCVEEAIFTSKEIYKFRGRKTNKTIDNNTYIWDRINTRKGYEYRINRDLPQLQVLCNQLGKEQLRLLNNIFKDVEESFPINLLYIDVAEGKAKMEDDESNIDELIESFKLCLDNCKNSGLSPVQFYSQLIKTEPYCKNEKLIEIMGEEIKKYEQ